MNVKEKGNSFEREISKCLSEWIFNDKDALYRDSSSGARKKIYHGDIVPQKQLPIKYWPLFIECKHGYKSNISNFSNFSLIEEWINKIKKENSHTQTIVFLIVKFHRGRTLLITDMKSNNLHKLSINLSAEYYVYYLKDLIKLNFFEVFPNAIEKYST